MSAATSAAGLDRYRTDQPGGQAGFRQGRCRVHGCFMWRGKPLVRDAVCPVCQQGLLRTTYLSRGPWFDVPKLFVTAVAEGR